MHLLKRLVFAAQAKLAESGVDAEIPEYLLIDLLHQSIWELRDATQNGEAVSCPQCKTRGYRLMEPQEGAEGGAKEACPQCSGIGWLAAELELIRPRRPSRGSAEGYPAKLLADGRTCETTVFDTVPGGFMVLSRITLGRGTLLDLTVNFPGGLTEAFRCRVLTCRGGLRDEDANNGLHYCTVRIEGTVRAEK